MRTALYVALCLSAAVGIVPASFAKDSSALDHCKAAATGVATEVTQLGQGAGGKSGVVVALPIGTVCIGPESLDGEPSYVRRTTGKEGMAIVEVSTTPFLPVLASNEGLTGGSLSIVRPDQPAGW